MDRPEDLASLYSLLAPDPNAEYGSMPWSWFARDKRTGERRFAMPESIRGGITGLLDLAASPSTGILSGDALNTFVTASLLGSAPAGSLAAGAARRAPFRMPQDFRVPQVTRADLPTPPPGIGHNMPPPEVPPPSPTPPPAPRPPYLDVEGMARKGKAFSEASKNALAAVAAGGIGYGPLDLSGDQRIPGIEQEQIPRYDPDAGRRKGVPEHMRDALNNPDVLQGLRTAIQRGVDMGADKWYHNKALYQAFVDELGPTEGHQQFQKYMDFQSAASPRSDVPTNIRNASYYYVRSGAPWLFEDIKSPYPYGHLGQNLHRKNADKMVADRGDWGGYDVEQNPKPPSYGTNLGGNLTPAAVDTHAFRLVAMNTKDPRFLAGQSDDMSPTNPWAEGADPNTKARKYGELVLNEDGTPQMKDGKFKIRYRPQQLYNEGKLTMDEALRMPVMWRSDPNKNEYKAVEDLYARVGREFGLAPAEAQSAAWAGGGSEHGNLPVGTGLGTPSNRTFGQMHNERVAYTAIMRGEDPKETLRKLIRREQPLLTPTPAAPIAVPGLVSSPSEADARQGAQRLRSLLDEQGY